MTATTEASEKTDKDTSSWDSLKQSLSNSLMSSFESVIHSRADYFSNPKNKKPSAVDIPGIINSYSVQNALVSGGANIIPGPWGMAGAIPEIGILMRNQIAMIYDIGVAYGNEKTMSKELVAGIMMSSAGSIGGKLLIVQGERLIVKRVSLRAFQKIVQLFGSRVLQQLLKSVISKWLPFVGALAMATWSNYSTKLIGRLASDLLNKKIDEVEQPDEDEAGSMEPQPDPPEPPPTLSNAIDKKRIRALIALMKIDQLSKQEEKDFIISQIANTNLSEEDRLELIALTNSDEQIVFDPSEYALDHDTAIGYINDMATLAKIDNELHPDEVTFIINFAKSQGISEADTQSIIEATTAVLEPSLPESNHSSEPTATDTEKRKRKIKERAQETAEQIQEREAKVQKTINLILEDKENNKQNDHGLQLFAFRPTLLSIVNRTNIELIGKLRVKYKLNANTSENRIACFLFDTITDYGIQDDGTSGTAKNYIRHIDNDILWRPR